MVVTDVNAMQTTVNFAGCACSESVGNQRYNSHYDGPQVLEDRDAIGGHYIAVMVDHLEDHCRYLVAGVAPERLRQFRSGILDLRTLLVDADADGVVSRLGPDGTRTAHDT